MTEPDMVSLRDQHIPDLSPEQEARRCYEILSRRRSVRKFSNRPVSLETIEWLIRCATTSPSGSNKQPWRFVCIRTPELKRELRVAAEGVEGEFYGGRANAEWLADLEKFGTDARKEFLEEAPWLIVVFKQIRDEDEGQVYYVNESVGIAVGLLLAAAQYAGLATLTHTPSPMSFLGGLLERSENERPFLLIPIGYPADDCLVPACASLRKPLDEVMLVL